MYASIGLSAFTFSLTVMCAALLALMIGWKWAPVRNGAIRIVVVFTIFAAAGAYVWIEVGPTADYTTHINENPRLPLPAPTHYWV